MASSVTYRDLLLKSRHGLPLWKPEPDANLPEVYTKQGISIGDLGLLTDDGGFDYLFNIHAHTHDPVNFLGTPPFFSPLPLNFKTDVRITKLQHPKKTCITRNANFDVRTIVGAGMQNVPAADVGLSVEFKITEEAAAMLVLPHGADRYEAKAHDKYKAYAFENAVSWYKFVNQIQQRGARNGALYLVTGCDKARSWGLAAGSPRRERTVGFSVKAMAGLFASGTAGVHASWGNTGGIESRHYPPSTKDITEDTNQCIFARGFVIGINDNVFKKKWAGRVRTKQIASSSKSFPDFGNNVPFRSYPKQQRGDDSEEPITKLSKRSWASRFFSAFRKKVPTTSPGPGDLPETPKPVLSPGSHICVHVLSSDSDIAIVLVHDDDWITATYKDAESIFTSGRTDYERLATRVLETRYPAIAAMSYTSKQRGGKRIAILTPKLSPSSLNPGLSSIPSTPYLQQNRDPGTFHTVIQSNLPYQRTQRPIQSNLTSGVNLSASRSPPISRKEFPETRSYAQPMAYDSNLDPHPFFQLHSSNAYPSSEIPINLDSYRPTSSIQEHSYDPSGDGYLQPDFFPGGGYSAGAVTSIPSQYTPDGYRVSATPGHPSESRVGYSLNDSVNAREPRDCYRKSSEEGYRGRRYEEEFDYIGKFEHRL